MKWKYMLYYYLKNYNNIFSPSKLCMTGAAIGVFIGMFIMTGAPHPIGGIMFTGVFGMLIGWLFYIACGIFIDIMDHKMLEC